ncbi:hypothetical protein D1871_09410 [Nakamurella silvestris]|nr:hypothetical protein D1871_09410 [Nakamurella silvestris]
MTSDHAAAAGGADSPGPELDGARPHPHDHGLDVDEKRLHPAYLLIGAGRTIRGLIPLFAIALFSWPRWVLYILGALVLVGAVVSWWTTRYSVTDRVLRLRKGLFNRSVHTISAARITGLDTERGLIQRVFGVWSLKVHSPGDGDRSTLELGCLSQAEIDRVRDALALPDHGPRRVIAGPEGAHGSDGPAAPDPAAAFDPASMPALDEVPLANLNTRTLLIAAVTGTSIPLILAGLFAVWNRAREVLPDSTIRYLEHEVFSRGRGTILVLAVLVLLASVVGVAFAALRLAGFTLRRDGERLRTSRGLLSQRAGTIQVNRVQAVRLVDGLWRRLLGYTAIQVEVAGQGGHDDSDRMLFPLLRTSEVADLVDRALPELGWTPAELTPISAAGRRRYFTAPVLLTVPIAVAGWLLLPRWEWLAVLPLVLAVLVARSQGRLAGWRLDERTVTFRARRILAVHTVIARVDRVQITRVRTNPFQRRAGLATVTLQLSSGRSARLRHLRAAEADLLLHTVGRRFRKVQLSKG